ncbi:hypothetical protein F5Y08DRAFT_333793 [Xylaria arbuscula]|nr:hypothetical protein F5Y08DRAFT_333793 [Xylaria arbuscula]
MFNDFAYSIYLRALWFIYQHFILNFNIPYVWGCPMGSVLLPFFVNNFSQRHLDCGVANGYFCATALEARKFHEDNELTLLDTNPTYLDLARESILTDSPRTKVRCVLADVTAPLPAELKHDKFDSISMFNLFHCVSGDEKKFSAFRTYKDALSDNGVLVGCKVLGAGYIDSWMASTWMRFYNSKGIFYNWNDNKEYIEATLRQEFLEVDVSTIGMMMVFKAKGPIRNL